MLKRLFRRHLPRDYGELDRGGSLRAIIGERLHERNLWRLNRRSLTGGLTLGVFLAWMPMPFQMLAAALLAIVLRVNLPIAVVTVWISNPLTWAPMYWFAYRVGTSVLGVPSVGARFVPEWSWFIDELVRIWQPLLAGCLLLASVSAVATWVLIQVIWRLQVFSNLAERRRRRAARASATAERSGD